MIDFQRTKIPRTMGQHLRDKVELLQSFSWATGDVKGSKWGYVGSLELKERKNGWWLENSLHTYYNDYIIQSGRSNWDDYNLYGLSATIDHLANELGINWIDTVLTCLEFGYNVGIDEPVDEFLEKVYMHKSDSPTYEVCNSGSCILTFNHCDYKIKLYDKSRQFRQDRNTLRVEVQLKRKEYAKYGVRSLEDLKDAQKISHLHNKLMQRFDELTIIDAYNPPSKMSTKEASKFKDYTNPKYWQRVKRDYCKQTMSRKRSEFNRLISDYDLDQSKQNIRMQMSQKFGQLICNPGMRTIPAI